MYALRKRGNQKGRETNGTEGECTRLTLWSTQNVHMYLFKKKKKKNDRYTNAHTHVHTYAKVSVPNTVCVKYFSLRYIILLAITYAR